MFSIVIMEKNLLSFIFQENACRKAYKKVFESSRPFGEKMQGFVKKHLHRHIYATGSAFSAGCLILRTMEYPVAATIMLINGLMMLKKLYGK